MSSFGRKISSASDLTLLQTPPVKRRTPLSKRPLLKTDTPKTPQSILKVRHNPIKRSPSPVIFPRKTKSGKLSNQGECFRSNLSDLTDFFLC